MSRTLVFRSPAEREWRAALPLVDDLSAVSDYQLTKHARERIEERGIGVMEVYSTLAEPEVKSTIEGACEFRRGDLLVAVDTRSQRIKTVADVNELFREADPTIPPRQPLNPLMKGTSMARRSQSLDEAWALVVHDSPDVRLMDVTPALAEKLLDLNIRNRRMRERVVDDYSEQMSTLAWMLTHEGVAIDSTGCIQDGQHRLKAIVVSGQTVRMFVFVGMDPAAYKVIGTGLNRTYADVIRDIAPGNATYLGSAARMVWVYLNSSFRSTQKVHNAQVLQVVEGNEKVWTDGMYWGTRLKRQPVGLPVHVGAAAYYLLARENKPAVVEPWLSDMLDMTFTGVDDPRKVLIRAIGNKHGRRVGPEMLAYVLKTWKATVEERKLTLLTWRRDEEMPAVVKMGKGRKG